jgi:hypothetical protein
MTIAKKFLLIAIIYGAVGFVLGDVMGATQNFTHIPTHTHILTLGWVSGALYALVYASWTEISQNRLAKVHLWFFELGVLGQVTGLFLYFQGLVSKGQIGLVMALSSNAILIGMIVFGWNVWRNAER